MIDWQELRIPAREQVHFQPPLLLSSENAKKAWVACRLFHGWADIMNDGPDDSDEAMANRWFLAAMRLARELRGPD